MQVVDNGPQFWFFLQDGHDYYLSIRCQQSFVEFELLLKLTPDEYREYHACGHIYIDYLATRANYWSSEYMSRNLSKQLGGKVHEAIMAWIAANPNAPR